MPLPYITCPPSLTKRGYLNHLSTWRFFSRQSSSTGRVTIDLNGRRVPQPVTSTIQVILSSSNIGNIAVMITRSQKKASGKPSLKPNRIRRNYSTEKERNNWECLQIDRMELEEPTRRFVILVKWPGGNISEHDKEEIYIKCPKKVCDLYVERRL
ncbi:hypothetical protein B0J15DRAFT_472389 [Fusarium solani]|uniref:Chromo shadow domain-containing protein n=1 Tax=Fusarium solani TaxID=169388 RepID=A0A9P9JTB7_FUSSL|nr:uncharacterized protein B0J15DRAFT_472389 [Fusarium solani]KAH7232556.1 hypothetical protein B0J15DRAFT_472389 [Fusarium solani]